MRFKLSKLQRQRPLSHTTDKVTKLPKPFRPTQQIVNDKWLPFTAGDGNGCFHSASVFVHISIFHRPKSTP